MSHTITFEIPDDYAVELRNRASLAGLDENEEAKRLFLLGRQASVAMASWDKQRPIGVPEKQQRSGLAGILDTLDDYLESEAFKQAYVASLNAPTTPPMKTIF